MQGSKITESTVHPRDCFHRDANELLMAQADKYDYDYLKSLIRMPNGKKDCTRTGLGRVPFVS